MQKEVKDLGVPPNSPYGHCGRKITVKKVHMTSHDVPNRVLYDFAGSLSVITTTRHIMRLSCSKIVTNKHHCLVDSFIVSVRGNRLPDLAFSKTFNYDRSILGQAGEEGV